MMNRGRPLVQALEGHPLPRGVADRFYEAAWQQRALETALTELFRRWGYGEFIPPTFEYAETLATEASQLALEMYRFVDRDGQTLALRPDMTIPTARLVGSKLYDRPTPHRFYYCGSVFRYEEPQAGRQREFTQAGVELIGAGNAAADAEVLALAVEALQTAGLVHFRLTLGQMAFIHGLLDELALADEEEQRLLDAIDRKSQSDLLMAIDQLQLTPAQRQSVQRLPSLTGTENVLARADEIALNETMRAAIQRLREIETYVDSYGVKDWITLDLAEARGRQYYTGITFECFAGGVGTRVGNGGRYDHLVERFGPPQPAVGFALNADALLIVRRRQGAPQFPNPPRLFAQTCLSKPYLQVLNMVRQHGFAVRVACRDFSTDELRAQADRFGEQGVLLFAEEERQTLLWWGDWPQPRLLTAALLEEVLASWNK